MKKLFVLSALLICVCGLRGGVPGSGGGIGNSEQISKQDQIFVKYRPLLEKLNVTDRQFDSLMVMYQRVEERRSEVPVQQLWSYERETCRKLLSRDQFTYYLTYKHHTFARRYTQNQWANFKDISRALGKDSISFDYYTYNNKLEELIIQDMFAKDSVMMKMELRKLADPSRRLFTPTEKLPARSFSRNLSVYFYTLGTVYVTSDVRLIDLKRDEFILRKDDDSQEAEQAKRRVKKMAESGIPAAMNMYVKYVLDPKGEDEAIFRWSKKSAEAGDARGQLNLFQCYRYGIGVESNLDKAFDVISRSDKTFLNNLIALGLCYYRGEGCEQSYAKAVSCFKSAFASNSVGGTFMYAKCLMNGYGVERDTLKASEYFKRVEKEKTILLHGEQKRPHLENPMQRISLTYGNAADVASGMKEFKVVKHQDEDQMMGNYSGSICFFDWSGSYILRECKVQIQLKSLEGRYYLWMKEEGCEPLVYWVEKTRAGMVFKNTGSLLGYSNKMGSLSHIPLMLMTFSVSECDDRICLSGNLYPNITDVDYPHMPILLSLTKM